MRVGIDLGTTYSVVASYDGSSGKTDVIQNKFQKNLTPSVICFMDDGSTIIGEEAKEMQKGGIGCIASVFKTEMGTNDTCVEFRNRGYTAEELSTILLSEMVKEAEESTGEKVESAVITVPAYFDDLQRTSTRRAAEKAGINVTKILNEPTAAAIYYGYKHSEGKTVLVYDLGGGTFDVTIVHIENGSINVIGTKGDHHLGGNDWDRNLMNFVCDKFYDEFSEDPRDDVKKFNEVLADMEDFKKRIIQSGETNVFINYHDNVGRYHVYREEFDDITSHLVSSTIDVVDDLLRSLGKSPKQIDEVLLCGGSTRMPQISKALKEFGFGTIVTHRDTDLAVAKGAAIVASVYSNDETRIRDITIKDVNAYSLGALSIDPLSGKYRNEIMIPVNTPIPTEVTKTFRIEEGNMTDQIEVYMLQGESNIPADCTIVKHDAITGFDNNGKGLVIDITYSYNEDGNVDIKASRNGMDLTIIHETVPEDTDWLRKEPKERKSNKRVSKNIAICVDLSRSMEDHMQEVKEAIGNFITSLSGEFTKFILIGFGDRAKALSEMTTDEDEILKAVEKLKPKSLGRGTDASPLPLILSNLKDEKGARMALILTDGKWGLRDDALDDSQECRKNHINIVAVGFGEADLSFLKQIATIEEGAMFTTLKNLGNTINTIATAIIENPTGLVEHFR